tara:strand:- start:9475 stop:10596 length:1122 start_codon:yes stop_codon:yes gene_type:complete
MLNILPRIFYPKEMVIKKGSLIRLKFLTGKKAAILIGTESLQKYGYLQKIEKYLLASKIEYSIIQGIAGDPSEKSILDISYKLKEIKPDWVIGVGGGSVMDTAKLAWALYENPEMLLSEFQAPFSIPELRKKAKLCLIPTTSGTGSEASNSAIVMLEGTKTPIISNCFIPDIVILDPNLTLNLPNKVTACTGIDAFSHAFESYCSNLSNPLTKVYAIAGAKLIFENLKSALLNPEDITVKEKLLYGSMLSGLAQGVTSVGGIHAMSHSLASSINLAHGHLNALFIIPILKFNAIESDSITKFLKEININDISTLDKWISEIMQIGKLNNKWGNFARNFNLDDMSQNITNDICARTNPRKLTVEGIKSILEETR